MAHYLVKARPTDDLDALRAELDSGAIKEMEPFGNELHHALMNARVDDAGWALWEENCYCNPPLKQEREVLDRYFDDLSTVTINKGEGWAQLEDLPSLWERATQQ